MGSLSFFLVVTILVVLFSIAYSKPLQYRFPIVVLCSSSSASSTGSTLLNISCNFRSSRKENLTNCGEASSFNFTLVPAGSSSISYCVSFNDLRNVTTFDSYGVMELVSPVAAQSIDAVVLLSEMPKMSNIPSLDVYSDFIYTASASLIVNVLQRPSDQVKRYLDYDNDEWRHGYLITTIRLTASRLSWNRAQWFWWRSSSCFLLLACCFFLLLTLISFFFYFTISTAQTKVCFCFV